MSRFCGRNSENNSVFDETRAQAKLLEELRKFRHDYKNQLWGLQVLLENGEYDRAKAYLTDITDRMNDLITNKCSYSDNVLIDAVLQKLSRRCEKDGISFDATVIAGNDLPLSDVEMCTVFSNLADNALEAVMRQDSGDTERFISFCTSRRMKWLTITVENSYDGMLKIDENGDIITQKEDDANHGIGLKSIKSVVENKCGNVRIEAENKIFRISLVFPRQEAV